MRRFVAWLCAAGLAALSLGCSSSDTPEQTGFVTVALTDAPTDLTNIAAVNITVDKISMHRSGQPAAPVGDGGTGSDVATGDAAAADTEGGWTVLCTDTQTLNLLDLTQGRFAPLCLQKGADGGTELRRIEVPAGRISQVRLHVVAAELVFRDGTPSQSLTIPSGDTSGLKLNVQRDVPAGGTLDLKIDFDAAESIQKQGNGEYKLRPVLKLL